MQSPSGVASAQIILRKDGIHRIRRARRRDVTEPYREPLVASICAVALYAPALVPSAAVVALMTCYLAVELWRARRARRLLRLPLGQILELSPRAWAPVLRSPESSQPRPADPRAPGPTAG